MLQLISVLVLGLTFLSQSAQAYTKIMHFPYNNAGAIGRPVDGGQDLNGDLINDMLVGGNSIKAYSGFDGTFIREYFDPSPSTASLFPSVAIIGDINGDMVADVLAADFNEMVNAGAGMVSAGVAYVFDGATGAILRTHAGSFPSENFGYSLAALPDVNLDTYADYAIGVNPGGGSLASARVEVYSGAPGGGILYTISGGSNSHGFAADISVAGKIDGDNIEDIIVGAPLYTVTGIPGFQHGRAYVYSGTNGSQILALDGTISQQKFGTTVSHIQDITGDMRDELLVGTDGTYVKIFSAVGGPALNTLTGGVGFGFRVRGLGDLNGDTIKDFAISDTGLQTKFYSGSFTAGQPPTLIFFIPESDNLNGIAPVGDLNADSKHDFIISYNVGSTTNDVVRVFTFANLPAAAGLVTGTGCGNATGPQPTMSVPVGQISALKLDEMGQVNIANLPMNTTGIIYASVLPVTPLPLGGGCTLFLDLNPANMFSLFPFTTPATPGPWSVSVGFPAIPIFAGLPIVLQAVVVPASNPQGFYLTNGVNFSLGY